MQVGQAACRKSVLNQLKQVMTRKVRGEAGLRLGLWRQQVRSATAEDFKEFQSALEGRMKGQGQGAGLGQLNRILSRMMQGEARMRLHVWSHCVTKTSVCDSEKLRHTLEEPCREPSLCVCSAAVSPAYVYVALP